MLHEVIEIGKAMHDKDIVEELFSRSTEPTPKIIVIKFDYDNNGIGYTGCELEDFDYAKREKYLYRKKSSNGPDFSPTARVAKDIQITFNKKILGWFKSYSNSEIALLCKLSEIFKNEEIKKQKEIKNEEIKEQIKKDIVTKANALDNKVKKAITLKINDKYIGEIDEFKDEFRNLYNKRQTMHASKGEIKGKGTCIVCGSKEKEVSPLTLSQAFPFATVEKIGFATHFSQSSSWKNIPLCKDCGRFLDMGKSYLDEQLNFRIYGAEFYIIPKFRFYNVDSDINVIRNTLDKISQTKSSSSNKQLHTLVSEEDYFYDSVYDKEGSLSFIYFFYKKEEKRIMILGVSEEVYPSWIKTIYSAMDESVTAEIFKENFLKRLFGESWEGNLKFENLGKEFRIFSDVGNDADVWNKKDVRNKKLLYIGIIKDILSKKTLSEEFIIYYLIKAIREDFKNYATKQTFENWKKWNKTVLNSIKILLFLKKLVLIRGEKMENEWEKKASFLTGVLVSKLLNVQYARSEGGSTPFVNKLHGLMINEKKVKDIFRQAKAKLIEYDCAYPDFEQMTSEAFLRSKENWSLSQEKISFYFTCGLCLGRGFENVQDVEKIMKEVFE
ncbi:MAG: TM1802 family CRISPR-associated protein [Nitrososphaeria archaeon]